MSLHQLSKELAPLAWEPQTWHEPIEGLSVRYLSLDESYKEWLKGKAGEGFSAMDDTISVMEQQ